MKIICANCNREMSLAEFSGYVEAYLLKVLEKTLVTFFVQACENLLLSKKRSFLDEQMAGLANKFPIGCPNCESIGRWNPIGAMKKKTITAKKENLTI